MADGFRKMKSTPPASTGTPNYAHFTIMPDGGLEPVSEGMITSPSSAPPSSAVVETRRKKKRNSFPGYVTTAFKWLKFPGRQIKTVRVIFLPRKLHKKSFDVVLSDGWEKHLIQPDRVGLVRNLLKNDHVSLLFSLEELKALCRLFRKRADVEANTAMSLVQFCKVVKFQVHDQEDDKHSEILEVMNQFFCQIDTNHDGVIDLREFLMGFSFWRDRVGSSKDKFFFFFTLFDEDRNNSLDMDEFTKVVIHVMTSQPHLLTSEEQLALQNASLCESKADASPTVQSLVEICFREADSNSDGVLTLDEFTAWAVANAGTLHQFGTTPDALSATFQLYDKDNDKRLNIDEFALLLSKTHDLENRIPRAVKRKARVVSQRIFDEVDIDNSGSLSFDEFRTWIINSEISLLKSIPEDHNVTMHLAAHASTAKIKAFEIEHNHSQHNFLRAGSHNSHNSTNHHNNNRHS